MAVRTVMTVLREIQAVKSMIPEGETREALLRPLLAEVEGMAEFARRQGVLPLTQSVASKAPSK